MQSPRWYAAVGFCALVIQLVGVFHVLQHAVENVLLTVGLFKSSSSSVGSSSARAPGETPPWLEKNTKVALVTGANRGLGLATAKLLARNGVHVLLLCRNRQAAEASVSKDTALRGLCTMIQVDLSSFKLVRKAASEVTLACMRMSTRLDYVICNAGIMDPPAFASGEEGYELQMQVNCLSHALLVHLLLKAGVVQDDKLSRIVSVSSFAHHGYSTYLNDRAGDGVVERMKMTPSEYHPKLAYAKSKWFQVLLMKSLSETIETTYGQNATCVSVNPGVVDTDMARIYCKGEFPEKMRWLTDPVLDVMMTPAMRRASTAASLVMAALTAPAAEVDGQFVFMGPTGRLGSREYGDRGLRWDDVIGKLTDPITDRPSPVAQTSFASFRS